MTIFKLKDVGELSQFQAQDYYDAGFTSSMIKDCGLDMSVFGFTLAELEVVEDNMTAKRIINGPRAGSVKSHGPTLVRTGSV